MQQQPDIARVICDSLQKNDEIRAVWLGPEVAKRFYGTDCSVIVIYADDRLRPYAVHRKLLVLFLDDKIEILVAEATAEFDLMSNAIHKDSVHGEAIFDRLERVIHEQLGVKVQWPK